MSSSLDFEDKAEKRSDDARTRKETEAADPALRTRLITAPGQDLGATAIHTGPAAQAEAERQDARALTRKQDIYFARDEYRPGTEQGNRLLVHELVHAIQQSGAGAETGDRRALEAEADSVAAVVVGGGRGRVDLGAPPGFVQKQEKGKGAVPSVQKHPDEIPPVPGQGSISGAGMTISYLYSSSAGANFVTLVLQVSEGIAVVATPLTDLHEGADFRVQNAAGTRARAVVIAVSNKLATQPKMQVAFTRGGAGYVVVFQFPTTAGRK